MDFALFYAGSHMTFTPEDWSVGSASSCLYHTCQAANNSGPFQKLSRSGTNKYGANTESILCVLCQFEYSAMSLHVFTLLPALSQPTTPAPTFIPGNISPIFMKDIQYNMLEQVLLTYSRQVGTPKYFLFFSPTSMEFDS